MEEEAEVKQEEELFMNAMVQQCKGLEDMQ